MFNTGGYSLADISAATGGANRNNDNLFGGNGAWIIIILFLFVFLGWGKNGFGNDGGSNGGGSMPTIVNLPANSGGSGYSGEIQRGFDTQSVISKLDGISNGLCDGFYAQNTTMLQGFNGLQNTVSNGFHGVDNAICNLGYQTQQGFNNTNMAMMQNANAIQSTLNNMAAQNASCCCETQRQIERGFADTNYNMATQACETRQAIADSTRNILDFLTQDKIATLTAENQSLKFAASQTAQNQFITQVGSDIVNRLQPVPVPAFPASNLYAYGNGSGCGCNSCC